MADSRDGAAEVMILGGARTPFAEWAGGKNGAGRPGGALAGVGALALGSIALKGALARAAVSPEEVDHVVFGNALQTGPDAIYGARHVSLGAGVPARVPALTVSRICGTGIEAVAVAARLIRLGEARIAAAGGTENLSQAPHVVRGLRGRPKLKHLEFEDYFLAALYDPVAGMLMAETAEHLARARGIPRAEQDAYAARSFRECARAQAAGLFAEELVPAGKGACDDHCVPDATEASLAALRPAFSADGCVTAGNASGVVDGAAALVLADRETAEKRGLKSLGRVVSWSAAGVEPKEMGLGPVPALKQAAAKAGLGLGEIELFEINEAFAAQYLAVEKELGLDRARCNVNGGAIALGHPLAATGTRLILTLLLELRRRGRRWGAASACIGGGQGVAMIVEAV